MGWPTLLCHRLIVENDRIVDYQIRIPEQKQKAVAALKLLNYHVIAAGDSFNDTAMLAEANVGFLFHAPDNIKKQFPQFKAVETYADLMGCIRGAMEAERYSLLQSCRNSASSNVLIPSCRALSSFDPASSPATT